MLRCGRDSGTSGTTRCLNRAEICARGRGILVATDAGANVAVNRCHSYASVGLQFRGLYAGLQDRVVLSAGDLGLKSENGFKIARMQTYAYIIWLKRQRMIALPSVFRSPPAARRALRKIGSDLKDARLRRGLPASLVAERAGISRPTMSKVEKGDPGVAAGIYASVLQALGLLDGLAEIADVKNDPRGSEAALDRLPKRAVLSGSRRKTKASTTTADDGESAS